MRFLIQFRILCWISIGLCAVYSCRGKEKTETASQSRSVFQRDFLRDSLVDTIFLVSNPELYTSLSLIQDLEGNMTINHRGIASGMKMILPDFLMKKYTIKKGELFGGSFTKIYKDLNRVATQSLKEYNPFIIITGGEKGDLKEKELFFARPFEEWVYAEIRVKTYYGEQDPNKIYVGPATAFLIELNETGTNIENYVKALIHYN